MDWSFDPVSRRHTTRLDDCRLGVWHDTATGRWNACVDLDTASGGATLYGLESQEAAQAWCGKWAQKRASTGA